MDKQNASEQIQYSFDFGDLDPFSRWANGYFNEDRIRTMIPRSVALRNFQKFIDNKDVTSQRFYRELSRYCLNNNLVLDPEELHNTGGRIIRKYKSMATEMIYVKPKD